jgi:hypothetical protein
MTSYLFNDVSTNWIITAKTIQPKSGDTLTVNGDLSGNVKIANDNTNATFYPVFVTDNSGNLPLKVDKTTESLSYNPGTNRLSISNLTIQPTDGISKTTSTITTNSLLEINSFNIPGSYTSKLLLYSGSSTNPSNARLYSQPDNLNSCFCDLESNANLYKYSSDGDIETYTAGVKTYTETLNNRPASMLYATILVGAPPQTLTAVRVINSTISMFSGSTDNSATNIASFDGATSGIITFYRPLTFNGVSGVLERSAVNGTTTGSTTLDTLSAFLTTINTPSATGRIFVLPTPTTATAGYWYGICNKSTGFSIAVQSPSGTTILTITIAANSGGGTFAKFAVNSAGNGYFVCS